MLALCYSALEEASPDEAVRIYGDACSVLEEDEKEQMAFNLYRTAEESLDFLFNYTRVGKKDVHLGYTDAATFLLRLGLSAGQCKASNSQCRLIFVQYKSTCTPTTSSKQKIGIMTVLRISGLILF
ncbi:hypothetical protein MKW98_032195 [Papaver atlanticum]|uniref:Uncharacterized protein n=1 Tax=Papaver atlanticum TaxID=357466 RepID=A0AAD4XDH1_9MAGN|nr:hypothetical protein MKW98_032195 [Papaver atlanticum]